MCCHFFCLIDEHFGSQFLIMINSIYIFIVLHGGFITKAGAVCLELLTPQGWVGGYTIESIIVQLAVTLVQGEARINFSALPNHIYTLQGKLNNFLHHLFSVIVLSGS